MTISAVMIEDSIFRSSPRLSTLQLRYPRFIHAEFMTHRMFSRNASSSRAIPVERLIQDVERDMAKPIYWGKNQPGMQAREELADLDKQKCINNWEQACYGACDRARQLHSHKAHKQIVNRILEPFSHINVVVTATEWDNFFALRDDEDAQPEIQALAQAMKYAFEESTPTTRDFHLPYILPEERFETGLMASIELCRVSAARCARVSYLTYEGKKPDHEADIELARKLWEGKPHLSPFEHPAKAMNNPVMYANFKGWQSYRNHFEPLRP